MEAIYKVGGANDIDLLVEWRLLFINDFHPELDEAKRREIRNASHTYFNELLENHSYIGFYGMVDQKVVCSAGILLYNLPPLADKNARKVAHLLTVFTLPEFRRNGYGRGLIEFIKNYCKERQFDRIFLNATEDGRFLYSACGFRQIDDAMVYKFTT